MLDSLLKDEIMSVEKSSPMPYVWAFLIFFLLIVLFILALLYMRPDLDPLILISAIAGIGASLFTGVAAFMKSQETHLSVNSQLSAWKNEFFAMAHAQGVIVGTITEQARVAEQLRVKNKVGSASARAVVVPDVTLSTPGDKS
jgi:hypothetical protein